MTVEKKVVKKKGGKKKRGSVVVSYDGKTERSRVVAKSLDIEPRLHIGGPENTQDFTEMNVRLVCSKT